MVSVKQVKASGRKSKYDRKHKPENCRYVHIKNCPGCGRSCPCYFTVKGLHHNVGNKTK